MNIYDEMYNYFINNELISQKILLDYAESIIIKKELSDYINSISIDFRRNSLKTNGYININPNEILYENADKNAADLDKLLSFKEKRTGIVNNSNLINIYNLFVINHELTHVYQSKLMNDNNKDLKTALLIKDELLTLYDVSFFKNFYYDMYHDYFYKEYDANMSAYIDTLSLINSFNIQKLNKLLNDINYIIAKNIIYMYHDLDNKRKITTPIKNMKKLYDHVITKALSHKKDLRNGHNFKDYNIIVPIKDIERLKLGLSINKDTYMYISEISNKKIKSLNIFDDINKRPN